MRKRLQLKIQMTVKYFVMMFFVGVMVSKTIISEEITFDNYESAVIGGDFAFQGSYIWYINQQYGLVRFNTLDQTYSIESQVPATSMALGPDGVVWFTTLSSGLYSHDGDKWTVHLTPSDEHTGSVSNFKKVGISPNGTV